jgi:hypothetical protein
LLSPMPWRSRGRRLVQGRSVGIGSRSCQSPDSGLSIRSSRSEERRGGEPKGETPSLIGCRQLPSRAAGRRLPHSRVSPAFFAPLRIHAIGHSAEAPGRTGRPRLQAECRPRSLVDLLEGACASSTASWSAGTCSPGKDIATRVALVEGRALGVQGQLGEIAGVAVRRGRANGRSDRHRV